VDASGNFYLLTGNGSFNATGSTFNTANNFAMSVLKFSSSNGVPTLLDYFSPHDEASLSGVDQDLGSGGPVLLPDQNGAHPHLAIVGGKDGNLFVVDRDHLGQYHSGSDDVVQTVKLKGGLLAAPAYWNQHVYVFGDGDVLQQLAVRQMFLVLMGQLQTIVQPRVDRIRSFQQQGQKPLADHHGGKTKEEQEIGPSFELPELRLFKRFLFAEVPPDGVYQRLQVLFVLF